MMDMHQKADFGDVNRSKRYVSGESEMRGYQPERSSANRYSNYP